MSPDDKAWLESLERDKDKLKVTLESNRRLDNTKLINLASKIESVFKEARALVS